jgi:hypothetical protein
MLVIDSSERTSCGVILSRLTELYEKCANNQDYAALGNPWHFDGTCIPQPVMLKTLGISEKTIEKLLAFRLRHHAQRPA